MGQSERGTVGEVATRGVVHNVIGIIVAQTTVFGLTDRFHRRLKSVGDDIEKGDFSANVCALPDKPTLRAMQLHDGVDQGDGSGCALLSVGAVDLPVPQCGGVGDALKGIIDHPFGLGCASHFYEFFGVASLRAVLIWEALRVLFGHLQVLLQKILSRIDKGLAKSRTQRVMWRDI